MSQPRIKASFPILVAAACVLSFALAWKLRQETVHVPAQNGGAEPSFELLEVGRPAPGLLAEGWLNGSPPTPESLQGRVVVVEAWASWCGPCLQEAPELVRLHRKYRDRGVVFVGLTTEPKEKLPQIEAFLNMADVTWVNGYGAVQTLQEFQAVWIPAAWVIGADGRIAWTTESGYVEGSTLDDGIAAALAATLQR